MHNIVDKLLPGIWGIWRYRWMALAVAWLIALLGWLVVGKIEHKYLAGARIYVDTNQVLEPLLQGLAVQPNVKERVALMSQTLLSRPNLEELASTTGLSNTAMSVIEKEELLDGLKDEIAIYDASGSRSLYSIAYANSDPQIAKQVVSTLIDIFVDTNLGEERADDIAAQRFLDARIAEYERRLSAAEKRLADFKRENAGSMPGESGGYFQRMETAQSQFRSASLSLREAQNRRDELKRQLESKDPVLVNPDPDWVPPDVARIQTLQSELDDLLVRYTDRHPRVAQLRETIADLQTAREQREQSPNPPAQRQDRRTPSLVHQQVSTMLAEAEGRVAELSVRVAQYRAELDEINATIDSIPQVEARLAQLDRDYATIRDQHATLLERRESARLTEAVKEKSDNVKFRVVDPPLVDARPAIPNKKVLNTAVLGMALAVGTGLSLLLALLTPVFFHRRGLSASSGLTVLGSVSLYRSAAERTKARVSVGIFVALAALLLAILPVLILADARQIDISQWLANHNVPVLSALINSEIYQQLMDSALVQKITTLLSRP